ncbi:MAG: hypothetical protein IJ572_00355 [Bacilli bacterium]|nr:hypothetical protein [Bacilli bacterium]
MKRSCKNIICIFGIILGLIIVFGTIYIAKTNLSVKMSNDNALKANMNMPPNDKYNNDNSNNNSENRGRVPKGNIEENQRGNNNVDGNMQIPDNSTEPPQMPDDNTKKDNTNNLNDDNYQVNDMKNKSEENNTQRPDDNKAPNDNGGNIQNQLVDKTSVPKLTIWYIIAIVCGSLLISGCSLYLIFSIGGKNNVFTNADKIIIFILSSIILTILISYGCIYFTNNNILLVSVAKII